MDKTSILFAKVAALYKSFDQLKFSGLRIGKPQVEPLIKQYFNLREELVNSLPDLFSDLPEVKEPSPLGKTPDSGSNIYVEPALAPIKNSLSYVLELRSNYRIGENTSFPSTPSRIFISHGRSKEWHKIQVYVEKTLGLSTLELAQEASLGRSVLQKLDEESSKCGYAVIVMTGDDVEGEIVKARENVMHEVGFFQGKLGLRNTILLHEEGVNIPSNIHGLVYISFPKDLVEAALGALHGELKVLMGN